MGEDLSAPHHAGFNLPRLDDPFVALVVRGAGRHDDGKMARGPSSARRRTIADTTPARAPLTSRSALRRRWNVERGSVVTVVYLAAVLIVESVGCSSRRSWAAAYSRPGARDARRRRPGAARAERARGDAGLRELEVRARDGQALRGRLTRRACGTDGARARQRAPPSNAEREGRPTPASGRPRLPSRPRLKRPRAAARWLIYSGG